MLKKNISLIAAASIASAYAAYGPSAAAHAPSKSDWTVGVGYGQMFSMKKINDIKVDKPTFFDINVSHKSGFGLVLLTSDKKRDLLSEVALTDAPKYKFNAYLISYSKQMTNEIKAGVFLGSSTQKVTDESNSEAKKSGLAYGASVAYHMPIANNICGGLEAGYLAQKKFSVNSNDLEGSGFFGKLKLTMKI